MFRAGKVTNIRLNQEPIRPSRIPSTWVLTYFARSALDLISARQSNPEVSSSASRLKFWGAVFFGIGVSLDTVWDSDKDTFQDVQQCVLKVFVDVFVRKGWIGPLLYLLDAVLTSSHKNTS